MKKNNKGFTLIELLVVVAIIGILAAVGTVAYSGYTANAKKASAKSNHASAVKYIAAEDQKCNANPSGKGMGDALACEGRTGGTIAAAAVPSAVMVAPQKVALLNPFVEGSIAHFCNSEATYLSAVA